MPGARLIQIAVVYMVLGLRLGFAMGIAGDFSFSSVHSHVLLLGWTTMAIAGGVPGDAGVRSQPACDAPLLGAQCGPAGNDGGSRSQGLRTEGCRNGNRGRLDSGSDRAGSFRRQCPAQWSAGRRGLSPPGGNHVYASKGEHST